MRHRHGTIAGIAPPLASGPCGTHLLTKHKCDTDEPCKILACGEGEDADAAGDEGDVGDDEGAHPGKIHQPAKDHAAHSVRYA